MQEKITIFNAQKTIQKNPLSPYGDNTFVFQTYEATSNLQMYNVLVKNFILNIPLNIQSPIRTFRRKENLTQYHDENISYIILDIDKIKSEQSRVYIVEYFKNYKVILGESKSFNGISNFNMKGILFTEPIAIDDAKLALSGIHHDLKDHCVIDESVVRRVSLNAPILRNKIFINNETGSRYRFVKRQTVERINEVKAEYLGECVKIDLEELQSIEADTLEKLCLKAFQTMGFEAMTNNSNGSITFKHSNEKKTPGGYFWFSNSPYTMHHHNSTRSVNIFDTVRKLPAAKELMKKDINYNDEFLKFNTDTSVIVVDEKYLKITSEIEDKIQEFLTEPDGLLSIRSPMGTGKSTIINHIIEESHEQDMRVLIITNRISVAKDFGKKYNIKIYNQDKYQYGDSLICQYDSLWRYNIKYFDIVIMDEFISLMTHARSNLNNSNLNITKFFASFNKKLVIADAFLTGYENFLLNTKKTNLHMIDNIYRDNTTLYSYDDFNYFVNSLVYHAEKHKITVSATSLGFITSLQMLLNKKGIKTVTLTADTPESTKNLIYNIFEQEDHDKWDVLIYSPTLTVGVSNLNNINYHFHYDSSMSTDVISSIQMIKRTRKAKEIHMHIKERVNFIKTSYNDIRDDYMLNIGKNHEQNYMFDVDNYGEIRLSETGKKAIKIDTFKNILEFDHKKAMFWLLKYHFFKEPRIINTTFEGNILMKYQKEARDNKQASALNNIEQFLMLNDIEKTNALLDSETDKITRILAEIDSEIKEICPNNVKKMILEYCLEDSNFIQKCKFYKVAFNFTKKIWDEMDVKNLVSRSVIEGKSLELGFYNTLIKHGQNEIFDEYIPKNINKDLRLKYILDKCGYKVTKQSEPGVVGHRGYVVDSRVKNLYGYIK